MHVEIFGEPGPVATQVREPQAKVARQHRTQVSAPRARARRWRYRGASAPPCLRLRLSSLVPRRRIDRASAADFGARPLAPTLINAPISGRVVSSGVRWIIARKSFPDALLPTR